MSARERWAPRPTADPWPQIAERVRRFAEERRLEPRHLLVLLPFAQHLPLAREAWVRTCPAGWMPRFETTQTLRERLPAASSAADGPSGDIATDRLAAARMLGQKQGLKEMRERDPAMFRHWVHGVVEMAHEFMQVAHAVAPARRAQWWDRAHAALGAHGGPGAMELTLARVALAWAAQREAGPADALFALRPQGWVAVHAGGPEPLVRALLDEAEAPVLEIDTDPAGDALFEGVSPDAQLLPCLDFEDEAQMAAAQVLRHLAAGEAPVALIAQDRVLVRRVRALLARQAIAVRDETGWRLSTTRAGACVAGLLRLAQPRAGTDDLLDWLKSGFTAGLAEDGAEGLAALETVLRRRQWSALQEVHEPALPERGRVLWRAALEALAPLHGEPRRVSLASWNDRLRSALQAGGVWDALAADGAGAEVLRALRLPGAAADDPGFMQQARAASMDLADYAAWVDSLLEAGAYAPEAPAQVEVVVTPLPRAMLRPFAAVVMPGCDEQRLGPAAFAPWLPERDRAALGLPTRVLSLQQQALAFAHLLRQPRVSLLWRQSQDGEPLDPGALVERLQLERSRRADLQVPVEDPRLRVPVQPSPQGPTAPIAPGLLPEALSATGYEALRNCPYRFFALYMLGLAEADELDDEIERRDYGIWLHAVLQRFHEQHRQAPLDEAGEVERLVAIGAQERAAQQLDEAAFLPYALRLRELARLYVRWLFEHERGGGQVQASEVKLQARLPGFEQVCLKGTLDRIDRVRDGQGEATLVVDYKTSRLEALKNRVKEPLEDTQLAFYAALLQLAGQAPDGGALRAMYLALDGNEVGQAEHQDVAASAQLLLEGMRQDLVRIAGGAALPPLGEGTVCEYCEAQGLCRKGHWSGPDEPLATGVASA